MEGGIITKDVTDHVYGIDVLEELYTGRFYSEITLWFKSLEDRENAFNEMQKEHGNRITKTSISREEFVKQGLKYFKLYF